MSVKNVNIHIPISFITKIILSIWILSMSHALFPAPPGFSNGNCTNCGMFDEELMKMKTTARIKIQILRKLGLTRRPAVQAPKSVSGVNGDNTKAGNRTEAVVAEITDIFSFSEAPENFTDNNIIQFTMSGHNPGRKLEVKSANLLIRVKYPRSEKRRKKAKGKLISLVISTVGSDGRAREVVASLRTEIKKTVWLKLTLPHSLVQNFIDSGQKSFLFHVKCQGCRKGTKIVLVHEKRKRRKRKLQLSNRKKKKRLNNRRPFLVLHTRVEALIRAKRSSNECPALGRVSRCCKSSIVVNFEDIGWGDWIISPRQFTTGECYGRCRAVTYDSSEGGRSEPRECRPTRTKQLRLAYLNDNGILIHTVLPRMIVTNCGCR